MEDVIDGWDKNQGLDAWEDVALDEIAVEDGIFGYAEPSFFEVVVEGGGDEALDLGW